MAKERVLRINQLIKKELNKILLDELDIQKDILITITRVETSSNLIQSKVYVSVLPESEKERVEEVLDNIVFKIQKILNKRLRIRPVPKIIFKREEEVRKASEIDEVFAEIDNNS